MENEISLAKFLSRRVNLLGKDLTKLKHDDVKVLFPYLKRCTFDMIRQNPRLVYMGYVVLVNDGRKTIPYYNPDTITQEETLEISIQTEEHKPKDDNVYDYSSLSVYELRLLLDKKNNSMRNQMCARRELKRRGIILHQKYNRTKEKELVMRRMKNERY